jgi:hypothetical protein
MNLKMKIPFSGDEFHLALGRSLTLGLSILAVLLGLWFLLDWMINIP